MTAITLYVDNANSQLLYGIGRFLCAPKPKAVGLKGEDPDSIQGITNIVTELVGRGTYPDQTIDFLIGMHPLNPTNQAGLDSAIADGQLTVVATHEVDITGLDDYIAFFTGVYASMRKE